MNYTVISTENRGSVGIITLKRPEALNAVNRQMLEELAGVVAAFEADDTVAVLVLRGSDKAFAAGIDVKELYAHMEHAVELDMELSRFFAELRNCRKPIIAAVAGYALGIGCQLALACDIVLAADNARFGQPEVSLGVVPGFGAAATLTRILGRPKAMEMILTGKALNAEDAERAGLVSRIVPLPDLFEESVRVAMRIAAQPRIAVLSAKEAVREAENLGFDSAAAYENKLLHLNMLSEDFKESLRAFNEKRPPNLKNRL